MTQLITHYKHRGTDRENGAIGRRRADWASWLERQVMRHIMPKAGISASNNFVYWYIVHCIFCGIQGSFADAAKVK